MSEEELPEGWTEAPLVNVAAPTPNAFTIGPFGSNLKVADYREDGVPLVFVRDIRAEFFGGEKTRFVSPDKATDLGSHVVRPGDVLITKMGEPPGDTAIYPANRPPGIITADCIKLTPNASLTSSAFLKFAIRSEPVRDQIAEQTMGVAQQKLSLARFREIRLWLPPLTEQRRIVEKVEALLARVNAARDRLARLPALLKRFRQSILAAACSGRLTEDWRAKAMRTDEWMTVALREVVESLDQGWSPKCDIEASPSVDVWGVIKTTSVQPLRFDGHENKRLPRGLEPRQELEVRPGDLLITRAGPRARAGVTCLVRAVRPRLMICDKVYRFRVRSSLALVEFVNLVLNEPAVLQEIDLLKTGISDSGVNLTQDKFLDLEMPLPTLDEQQEIVRRVDALFALADAIEKRVADTTTRVDALPQSILSKAFRGDLVPTEASLARTEGRDYESATALLERVRTEEVTSKRPTARTRGSGPRGGRRATRQVRGESA